MRRRFKRPDEERYEYWINFKLPIESVVTSDVPLTAEQAVIQVMTDPEFPEYLSETEIMYEADNELHLRIMEDIGKTAELRYVDE